ncbi:hypothetical protein [Brevundimonas sp.]
MRIFAMIGLLTFATAILSACETVSGVVTNATGSPTEVVIRDIDGQSVRIVLPEAGKLVLRQSLAEIDHIEYGRGCRLTGEQIQAGPAPAWNESRSILLTVCDGATP